MSKAELFQQLEALSPEELDQVAERVDELRFREDEGELTPEQLELVRARVEYYREHPNEVRDLDVVVAEIRATLKK